jgi:hypothetical protein
MDRDLIDLFGRCFLDHIEELFCNHRQKLIDGTRLFEAPVIGGWHPVSQFDAVKNKACRAAIARVWWQFNGPSWSRPLPLSSEEIQEAIDSNDARQMLVGYFANSLQRSNYDFRRHPSFFDFCSALMASPYCPFVQHHMRIGGVDRAAPAARVQ